MGAESTATGCAAAGGLQRSGGGPCGSVRVEGEVNSLSSTRDGGPLIGEGGSSSGGASSPFFAFASGAVGSVTTRGAANARRIATAPHKDEDEDVGVTPAARATGVAIGAATGGAHEGMLHGNASAIGRGAGAVAVSSSVATFSFLALCTWTLGQLIPRVHSSRKKAMQRVTAALDNFHFRWQILQRRILDPFRDRTSSHSL